MKKQDTLKIKKSTLLILLAIILVLVIVLIFMSLKKSTSGYTSEFESKAVYGYLENEINVYQLYKLAGKLDYDETQIFQSKLKQALDNYFSSNTAKTISTSEAVSLVDSQYVPGNVDFHGIIVSGYEYDPEKDEIKVSANSFSNMGMIESNINAINYSTQSLKVTELNQVSETEYNINFNILEHDSILHSGTANFTYIDDEINVVSCTFND